MAISQKSDWKHLNLPFCFLKNIFLLDGFCAVEETDFGLAKDRNCYLGSIPKNTTNWAKNAWDTEYSGTTENPHNDDKNDFSTDAKVRKKRIS